MKIRLIALFFLATAASAAEWRCINGQTNLFNSGTNWWQVRGRVVAVYPAGLHMSGEYFRPGQRQINRSPYEAEFLLAHPPNPLGVGEKIELYPVVLAFDVGVLPYNSGIGGLRAFDCGIPCGPHPAAVMAEQMQTSAQRAQRDRNANAAKPKLIAWEREQATNGVASAMYALGMRYLKADGLPQDKEEARAWLDKAAAKGHAPAKKALVDLK